MVFRAPRDRWQAGHESSTPVLLLPRCTQRDPKCYIIPTPFVLIALELSSATANPSTHGSRRRSSCGDSRMSPKGDRVPGKGFEVPFGLIKGRFRVDMIL